jgi:hypothetical protein
VSVSIVVDESIACRLASAPLSLRTVPRARVRLRVRHGGAIWRPLDRGRVIDILVDIPAAGRVLVRPGRVDPGGAFLAVAARLVGHEVVWLPEAMDEAVWSVGVALSFAGRDLATTDRALDVVCGGPASLAALPRRDWGGAGTVVPTLRPATIARLAYCAWVPCGWCDAGGLAGRRCARCGSDLADAPLAAVA